MPDFGPYLIFRLYLSRMQKYAFFPASPKILGEKPSPARLFLKKLFGSSGACGASGNGVIRRGHMEKTTSTTFTTMNKNQATEETKSRQLRKSQKKSSIFALAYLKDR